jgi:hypothetical protein
MSLTALTLFSGGGLADVGIRAAGFRIVGAVEYDAAIASVYALNHGGDHLEVGDVAEVDYTRYADVDWAHASPSCKNASQANPNAGEVEDDLRAAAAVCRMLREARPRWFTLENVTAYARLYGASRQRAMCRLRSPSNSPALDPAGESGGRGPVAQPLPLRTRQAGLVEPLAHSSEGGLVRGD